MKALTKNKLAMGVGAIVGCMGMVPVANAVHFAPDGLGDALVNYYNVQERRTTLINYTNTSDKTIAMRVRLHEARNSRSVDFTVILSPYDVWNATIADGGGDVGPVIFTADNSCTIPKISQDGANPTPLKGAFMDAGVTDLTAMREGYVAAIVMGSKDGEPLDCRNAVSAVPDSETEFFVNKKPGGYAALLAEYPNYTNNAIKGVYNLLNIPLGQNAAAGMTTLADFFSSARPSAPYSSGAVPDYLPAALNGANLINLVTLQLDPGVIDGLGGMTPEQRYLASFNLPTLASANTFAYLLLGDNAVLSSDPPVNRVGAQALSYLFARTNVINMWTAFQGATWDTATDLVVQSYVKQFYVDDGANPFSGRYQWKPGVPPTNAIGNGVATGPFASPFDGERSCDRVSWDIWDREENMDETPDSGRFSPTPAATDALCFETNRISFNKSYALGQPLAYNINSVFDNGWIDLDLRGAGNIYGTGQRPYNPIGAAPYYYGLPVDSFAFTTRVRDDGLNEAIIVPSAYKRNPEFNSVTMQINSY